MVITHERDRNATLKYGIIAYVLAGAASKAPQASSPPLLDGVAAKGSPPPNGLAELVDSVAPKGLLDWIAAVADSTVGAGLAKGLEDAAAGAGADALAVNRPPGGGLRAAKGSPPPERDTYDP